MNNTILFSSFLLAQLFMVLFISCNYLFSTFSISLGIILFIMLFEIVLNVYFFKEISRLSKAQREVEIAKLKLEQSQQLLSSFRAKHHDFINHLQVIMGLTQLKKYDEVLSYGRELSRDLIQIEKLITLNRPELAALIISKIAGLSYVQANISVKTTLEHLQSIQPDKLVSIVGNLLDNALYEIAKHDAKWISISIAEDDNWYIIQIENPGSIEPEIRSQVFAEGFTTKGEKGTGMGLFIVSDLVAKANGKVELVVNEEDSNPSVRFTVQLPREQKSPLNKEKRTATKPDN